MAPSEALTLVVLGPADAPDGLALSEAAGWNQTAEDWRLFSRTGVTHLMSISGLHVTLISGMVAATVILKAIAEQKTCLVEVSLAESAAWLNSVRENRESRRDSNS